jgi:hypothetical protein
MTDKTTEFRVDGDHLLYDPDTGIGGDEVVIVDGRLKTFTVTNLSTGTGVSTVLELQNENSDEIAITSAITTFRN